MSIISLRLDQEYLNILIFLKAIRLKIMQTIQSMSLLTFSEKISLYCFNPQNIAFIILLCQIPHIIFLSSIQALIWSKIYPLKFYCIKSRHDIQYIKTIHQVKHFNGKSHTLKYKAHLNTKHTSSHFRT